MTLPEGSVVNPKFPAACGVRYATVLRIYDAVLGALARAVPEDIPAASGGQGCMVALSLPDPAAGRRHVTVIEPMIGGGGGRPSRDGVDGCDASLGFLKTTPAETLEVGVLALEPGDVLSVRTPGGGGHGPRFTRPPSHVLADVMSGLISREHARAAYGVVLDGDRVDEPATAALRETRRGESPAGTRG